MIVEFEPLSAKSKKHPAGSKTKESTTDYKERKVMISGYQQASHKRQLPGDYGNGDKENRGQ
jgi:hypothetical protein